MQELVEFIVKSLVDHPEDVTVTAVEGNDTVVYEVRVADGDVGQVIGRHGRIAKALRTVVRSVPSPDGLRHTVEVISR